MGNKQSGQQPQPHNCVPTAPPPPELVNNCIPVNPPPQYSTLYPTLTQVQQLKAYIKSQVKSTSLQRAGVSGSDPWGTEVAPEMQHLFPHTTVPLNPLLGEEPEPAAHGAAAGLGAALGSNIFSQPQSLLNLRSGQNGTNGSPQILNHEITYYAPTFATNEHRECINCCEDCLEDVCENCCLNCCLDCSKLTNLTNYVFGPTVAKVLGNGNQPEYVLLGNTVPLNAANGLPIDPATGQPINPLTGEPINPMTGCPTNPLVVCPMHQTTGCATNLLNNVVGNKPVVGNISL